MTLPNYWRRASFTVAETAELIGVSEETLRTWLARNPSPSFLGAKTGSRLYLSGQDAFFYWLLKEFTAFGVPVRDAMRAAEIHAEETDDELLPEKYLVVRTRSGLSEFALTDAPHLDERSTLVIPIQRGAEILLERMKSVFDTPEGSPVKLHTVGGRPIREWATGVEAELARMPVTR